MVKKVAALTPRASEAFMSNKQILANAVKIGAFPKIMYDSSNDTVNAALNQVVDDTTHLFSFFSMKLSSNRTCCSTFGQKLLNIYKALHNCQPVKDSWQLTIHIDYEPLNFKPLYSAAIHLDQFEYVYLFTWDIAFSKDKDNAVIVALSRLKVYAIANVLILDFEVITLAHENDVKLRRVQSTPTALQLKKTPLFLSVIHLFPFA